MAMMLEGAEALDFGVFGRRPPGQLAGSRAFAGRRKASRYDTENP